jgi:hypothetical protein
MLNYQRVTIVNDGNGTLLKHETNSREFVGLNGEYTRTYHLYAIKYSNGKSMEISYKWRFPAELITRGYMKIIEDIDVVGVSPIYNFSIIFMVFALPGFLGPTYIPFARPKSHPLSKISIKVLGELFKSILPMES